MWRMAAQDSGGSFTQPNQAQAAIFPRQLYFRCSSQYIPCPEALGYTMGRTLGSGTYAKVKAAWSPFEGRMIAIKNLNKKQASQDYLTKFLPREIAILQRVSHSNIINVFQIVETDLRCFFALEIAENGDLLDYINSRKFLPEPEARFVFHQMSEAISYCHSLNIVHRDLKCENIMLSRAMDVKIGDFGFALDLTTKPSATPCGSYSYAAPELFTANGQQYNGKKADSWSMGVILYAMVCGRLPFGDDAQVKKLQAHQRRLEFSRNLTAECKSLIQGLLNMNIELRPSVHEALTHGWTQMIPSTRPREPSPVLNSSKYKHTIGSCLPSYLHSVKSRSSGNPEPPWSQLVSIPYPRSQSYAALMQQQLAVSNGGTSSTAIQPQTAQSMEGVLSATDLGTVVTTSGSMLVDSTSATVREQKKQLVHRIGAAGRRLADAVKGVKREGHKSS